MAVAVQRKAAHADHIAIGENFRKRRLDSFHNRLGAFPAYCALVRFRTWPAPPAAAAPAAHATASHSGDAHAAAWTAHAASTRITTPTARIATTAPWITSATTAGITATAALVSVHTGLSAHFFRPRRLRREMFDFFSGPLR